MRADFEPKAQVLDSDEMRRAITRIAHEILEHNKGAEGVVLVGLHTRGVPIAHRIAAEIGRVEQLSPTVGTVDIAFYRDDIGTSARSPVGPTEVPVPIDGACVVLVDDVLYTGRSVRAAMEAIGDFGRPRAIRFAVLVDRGHRELPVRADYVGKNLPTARDETIRVRLGETDGLDSVEIGAEVALADPLREVPS